MKSRVMKVTIVASLALALVCGVILVRNVKQLRASAAAMHPKVQQYQLYCHHRVLLQASRLTLPYQGSDHSHVLHMEGNNESGLMTFVGLIEGELISNPGLRHLPSDKQQDHLMNETPLLLILEMDQKYRQIGALLQELRWENFTDESQLVEFKRKFEKAKEEMEDLLTRAENWQVASASDKTMLLPVVLQDGRPSLKSVKVITQ